MIKTAFSTVFQLLRKARAHAVKLKSRRVRRLSRFCSHLALILCGIAGLHERAIAQEVLVINVNVFGTSQNQEVARTQIQDACAVLANDTGNNAQDLRSTCDLIATLDPDNPQDAAQLQQILSAIAPEEAFSLNDSVVYAADYQTTSVRSRLNAIRSERSDLSADQRFSSASQSQVSPNTNFSGFGGGAATSDLFSKFGVFFSGRLSTGEVDGDILEQDSEIESTSFTMGSDLRLGDAVVVGAGLGIIQNNTTFAGVGGSTDSQGINLTFFGSWYEQGSAYVDAVLDIGQNAYELERDMTIDPANRVSALGETDSSIVSFTASAGAGFNLASWELGGYLRLSLVNAEVDAYNERASNAGVGSGAVFSISSQSIASQTVVIGTELSRVFSTTKAVVIPVIRFEYETQNEKKKDAISATLDGAAITRPYGGTDRDTSYANLGVGGSIVLPNGKSAYAFYETHIEHEFVTQNWLKLGLRLEF